MLDGRRFAPAVILLASTFPASAGTAVDLELVLAVDTSRSVDGEEYTMQKEGYAAAFSNPAVIDAVKSGTIGVIAVTYVEWSGVNQQNQNVGWMLVDDEESARAFAAQILGSARSFSGWTSISDAIDFAAGLIRNNEFDGTRLVIDMSADGVNNNGRPVMAARDDAVAAEIVINGLPILTDNPMLESYFAENVVGGPGSFVVPAKDFNVFSSAILSKLIREIASLRTAPRQIAEIGP